MLYLSDAVMVFKCIDNLVPDYLENKFILRSQICNRNTRNAKNNFLDIPYCRLATGQRSFSYRGSKLWNELSHDLRTVGNLRAFRRGVMAQLRSG